MAQDYSSGSRSRIRAKRKKTNLILNSLIAIVLLLILAVGFSIFAGNDDSASNSGTPTEESSGENNGGNSSGGDSASGDNSDEGGEDSQNEDENEADQNEADENGADKEEPAEPIVTEGGSSPNVKRTIENPEWEPVGTNQTGPHEVVVDDNHPDWQEMHEALAYAIGTDVGNMTTWWLERDRSTEGGAIGTVTAKGSDQAYRVYIQWVDGQGYKPVKVEELVENDKK